MEDCFITAKNILYNYIDRMEKKTWPADLYDHATACVRKWLSEKCASLEDITALAQSMGLTDSQHQEFVDLVTRQIALQSTETKDLSLRSQQTSGPQSFSLQAYAKNYPKLSCKETAKEVEIVQVGNSANTRLSKEGSLLRSSDIRRLKTEIAKGKDAEERLLMGHINLVINIAKRYGNWGNFEEDLIQEGFLAMIEAMQRFVPERAAFSTYALPRIKKYILTEATNLNRQIPISQYEADSLRKIQKAMANHKARTGQNPTIEDISKITGFSVRRIKNVILNEWQSHCISIDAMSCNINGVCKLLESIPDPSAEREFNKISNPRKKINVKRLIHKALMPKEAEVILLRFWFEGKETKLEDIGKHFKCSKENVRLIQKKAIAKLREALSELGIEKGT